MRQKGKTASRICRASQDVFENLQRYEEVANQAMNLHLLSCSTWFSGV